jgi:hypothetical protein
MFLSKPPNNGTHPTADTVPDIFLHGSGRW